MMCFCEISGMWHWCKV